MATQRNIGMIMKNGLDALTLALPSVCNFSVPQFPYL